MSARSRPSGGHQLPRFLPASHRYAQDGQLSDSSCEAEVDKAMKNAAVKNTNNLITKREGDLVETQNDLKNTQVELDAALASLARMACTHMKSKLCHPKGRIP